MVETIYKHTCDGCKKEVFESNLTTMFTNGGWLKVRDHHSNFIGVASTEYIFCGFKCLSEWAYKQALKQVN